VNTQHTTQHALHHVTSYHVPLLRPSGLPTTECIAAASDDDMRALNSLPPAIVPKAIYHIGEMIAMIETLIAKEHAYTADGHVLFAVESMPGYGRLSGRNPDDMRAGARVEVAEYKRHPGDSLLRTPSSDQQPGRD